MCVQAAQSGPFAADESRLALNGRVRDFGLYRVPAAYTERRFAAFPRNLSGEHERPQRRILTRDFQKQTLVYLAYLEIDLGLSQCFLQENFNVR